MYSLLENIINSEGFEKKNASSRNLAAERVGTDGRQPITGLAPSSECRWAETYGGALAQGLAA